MLMVIVKDAIAQTNTADFANAQKIYQERLAKIEETYAAKPKAILANYAKDLDALEQSLAKKSNLDGVMAVRQDKEDLKLANDVPDNINDKTPAELKALKEKYKVLMAGVESGKKQEIASLSTMYIGRLEKMRDALTIAMKIDDALAVKAEIDKVKVNGDLATKNGETSPATEKQSNPILDLRQTWTPKDNIVLRGHTAEVRWATYTPDGRRVVSCGADKSIILWDLPTGQEVRRYEGHTGPVNRVCVTPNGKQILSASDDGTIRLWNLETGQKIKQFEHGSACVVSPVRPDYRTFLSYDSSSKTIQLWDIETSKQKKQMRITVGGHPLAYSNDGKKIFAGGIENAVRLWDVTTGNMIRQQAMRNHQYTATFNERGTLALSGGGDSEIHLWSISPWKEVGVFPGQPSHCYSVAFSPNDSRMISGYDRGNVILWDCKTFRRLQTYQEHTGAICHVEFSPNDSTAISSSRDGTVRLWVLPPKK